MNTVFPRASQRTALFLSTCVFITTALVWLGITGCRTTGSPTNVMPTTFAPGPSVKFQRPEPNAILPINQPATVYAILTDATGVLRADLIVDGVIVNTQPLTIASRRFDYLFNWQPNALGQHALTIVGYNVNNIPGNSVTRLVNVMNPAPLTPPTPTPWVIRVTATPNAPQPSSPTPWVIVVTSTPFPTPMPTATPYYVVVTSTPPQPTQTPFIMVVTSTPPLPSPTPIIIVVPYGQ